MGASVPEVDLASPMPKVSVLSQLQHVVQGDARAVAGTMSTEV